MRSLPESHHRALSLSLSLLLLARSFHQSHHGQRSVSVSIYPVIGQIFSPEPSLRAECLCIYISYYWPGLFTKAIMDSGVSLYLYILLLARSFHQSHRGELGVSISIYHVIGQVFSPKPSWRAECPCHPEQCGYPERSRIPAARPRSWRPVWVVLQLTPLACWPASGPRTRRVSSKQRLVRHTH